ncbi:MAG: hypothetical protein JSS00_03135 [Proteobacteria bacterium]|nr:hypothetical protein [Pseudomonadota bacterium]
MGLAAPFDIDKFLGGPSPAKPEPRAEAGAVHANGIADIARLVPLALAPQREKPRRSILVNR